MSRHHWIAGFVVILLLGGLLRFVDLGQSPPGLNQDEAAEAWNAWCIFKTGEDQVGRSWPLLYSRCHGSNRSTLFMYLLIPFEAIVGLSPLTNRLPSPFIGVACIALTFYVGRRMFGPTTGWLAALLLALNPWHIQLSRWGHQAVLCPLLAVAGLAGLLWMGLPINGNKARPRLVPAMLAGLAWGLGTWLYPSSRIFTVLFFAGIAIVTWRAWVEYIRAPGGKRAALAMALVGGSLFAPMAYYHLRHPEIMSVRLKYSAVFKPDDSVATKLVEVAKRYPGHFGPDFLFVHGDAYDIQSPPGMGQFYWYMAPLMALGLIVLFWRFKSSPSARILLVWILLYPTGDCLSRHGGFEQAVSMHALRSSPGVCGLVLLGALGAAWVGTWLYRRHRFTLLATGGVMVMLVIALNACFLMKFLGQEYNGQGRIYHSYHVDLLEACEWLRPRLNDVDAVFCTTKLMNLPYIITLVGLGYDPEQWFRDARDVHTPGQWDVYTRYGKMHFLYSPSILEAEMKELRENGRRDRVVFLLRPGELKGLPAPVHEIRRPDGNVVLQIFEVDL